MRVSVVTPVVQQWIDRGLSDPEAFWALAAGELPWFRSWDRVFEWNFPTFRWFVGAETNLAYNAVDRHVANGRGGHPALIYMNERGERRTFTYSTLLTLVERIASALRRGLMMFEHLIRWLTRSAIQSNLIDQPKRP